MNEPLGLARRLRLMVITDPAARTGVLEASTASLAAGAGALQLRWKGAGAREMLELARSLRELTRMADALLIVNDRLDVAIAAGADGVHLGDDDLPLDAARRLAPSPFIIGRSVDTPEEAVRAQSGGADYVGFGPIYPTGTKLDTGPVVGAPRIGAVRRVISIPLVGIGGINPVNARAAIEAGADGVAVIGAVMMGDHPGEAVRELLAALGATT